MSAPTGSHSIVDVHGLAGTVFDRKLQVEAPVARGGFGLVYRAQHLTLQRPVAIKVLTPPAELDRAGRDRFLERFAAEARTIARLRHPNIVQVLDFGASKMPSGQSAAWMVLEWLEGQTLAEELAARPARRRPAEVLALMQPVIDAVAYAHREGVAHRDLKPENMVLAPGPRGVALRLLDFGIAKVMEEGESVGSGQTSTLSSVSLYSPAYASPEQVARLRTGPWTDIHALGLILTELLTGQSPYHVAQGLAPMTEVNSPTRPTPAQRGVDVGAWEPVLRRAMALNPAERYQNAGDLLAALSASVGAAHPSIAYAPGVASVMPATPAALYVPTGASAGAAQPAARSSGALIAVVAVTLVLGGGAAAWLALRSKPAGAHHRAHAAAASAPQPVASTASTPEVIGLETVRTPAEISANPLAALPPPPPRPRPPPLPLAGGPRGGTPHGPISCTARDTIELAGVEIHAGATPAVHLEGNCSVHLVNCVLESSDVAVWGNGVTAIHLENCELRSGAAEALRIEGAGTHIIDHSDLTGGAVAARLAGGPNVTFESCTVTGRDVAVSAEGGPTVAINLSTLHGRIQRPVAGRLTVNGR